jgi:hypothetical protein
MIEDKYIKLIKKLTEMSNNGKVNWNQTSRDTEFKVSLKTGSVTTDFWKNNGENYSIDFSIRNDKGDSIYHVQADTEEGNDYDLLVALHNSAKSSYFKVDETIENMIEELGKSDTVGLPHDDEELPF